MTLMSLSVTSGKVSSFLSQDVIDKSTSVIGLAPAIWVNTAKRVLLNDEGDEPRSRISAADSSVNVPPSLPTSVRAS